MFLLPLFIFPMLQMKLFLLLLCTALCLSSVASLTYVECAVDCDAEPGVSAAVHRCLVEQNTLCEHCELAVYWKNDSVATSSLSEAVSHCKVNRTAQSVACSHIQDDVKQYYRCIPYTQCKHDPDVIVRVQLSGTCNAATLNVGGIASLAYFGPATVVGQLSNWNHAHVGFINITFDGNGTAESLITDDALTSNITMVGCEIAGFNGSYVINVKARDYFVLVELLEVYIHDVSGSVLYTEGLWGLIVRDVVLERCTDNEKFLHYVMSPLSDGKVDVANVKIN